MGVVIRGKTFKLTEKGGGGEENVHIQFSVVLLEKARWEQRNALGSEDGSVLGADCRKCAAEEIS